MRAISRASLASLVCPSAPFLVPASLRAPLLRASCFHTSASLQKSVQKSVYQSKKKRQAKVLSFDPRLKRREENYDSFPQPLHAFRSLIGFEDLPLITDAYPTLLEQKALESNDTLRIAKLLHNYFRNSKARRAEDIERFYPFLEQVTQDIQAGDLPPNPYAHVHILSIYKELQKYEAGAKFWNWLSTQNDYYVNQAVYGAAIELLAYQGTVTLPQLEDIYNQGLRRFPGTYAEYHLSPEAILPDRSQPTVITGLPISLVQGILTARMMARDWKNSYLSLDAVLRLYPTQVPTRIFELFIHERPISEGYTVFLLACRAGIKLKPNHLTKLLVNLTKAMDVCNSLEARVTILRGMVTAIYAYVGVSGILEGQHIAVFIRACGHVLPPRPHPAEDYAGDSASMRRELVAIAHGAVADILECEASGTTSGSASMFGALITLAGKLNAPALFTATLTEIEAIGGVTNNIERRNILTTAGILGMKHVIQKYWGDIVAAAENEGHQLTHGDWISLARAARRAGYAVFFEEQCGELSHTLTERTRAVAYNALAASEEEEGSISAENIIPIHPETFETGIEEIQRTIQKIVSLLRTRTLLNFDAHPIFMFLDPTRLPLGSISDLRAVYDELTTDPHQPPPQHPDGTRPKPALSPTGIPLDELRFQNWVTVMELMSQAEGLEVEFQKRMQSAIEKGGPLGREPWALGFEMAYAYEEKAGERVEEMAEEETKDDGLEVEVLEYVVKAKVAMVEAKGDEKTDEKTGDVEEKKGEGVEKNTDADAGPSRDEVRERVIRLRSVLPA
ncbi:hypothetical protein GQ43DRAFT_441192 [Delitschia confertaspora ATCC 74209]|uniref:Uncharacterized protein n=1 Tax=Delitschia confertaspora ATCC 74209 TaxID=1513339 RepID=A0A9P4MYF6_9PLEO|nr:hypothetical protein GQ43DRAFT_441192 [Delitschia confertaspora ATCC 74209]